MADTKILIVENISPFDREIGQRLRTLGYTVCASFSSGAQAIEKIPEMQPDLVMVNIGLEGAMAAVEAAEKIYHHFDIPVIYLIDSIEDDVLERIRRTRVFGHIFKPFDTNQLCLGIEHQLHWHRVNHANTESDEQLSTILNNVGDAIIAVDQRGLITFMNPVAETLTGWEMEEASGNHVTDILNIYIGNQGNLIKNTFVMEALQKGSIATGGLSSASELDHNTWLIAKSGREIPIDYNITPVKDGKETPTGIVITFREIAEHKTTGEQSNRTISELGYQTQLMKTVFDSMYDGIVVLNLRGEVLFVNPSIQKMFGRNPLGPVPDKWSENISVFYPDKHTRVPLDQILAREIFQGVAVRDQELFVCSVVGTLINSNSVSDISPLAGLNNLTQLWLERNNITDLSPLAGLNNLTHLVLWNNFITDLSPLAGLSALTRLDLYYNLISDVSPLAGLTNLTVLQAHSNFIADISPLDGLNNLLVLWLDGNNISDLSPLTGLTRLKSTGACAKRHI